MFDTLIIQPILNLLFIIYSIVPGHDFGVAIIIFTVVIRGLLWPLVKKQLHQTKAMRELQPEIKKVKAKAAGDRQKEGQMLMELYKEREINPFGSIGILLVQLPILFGLFRVLRILSSDQERAVDLMYSFVKNMPSIPELVEVPAQILTDLQHGFFGAIDLSINALNNGSIYWPLMIIALVAGVMQFIQTRQLMPDTQKSRKLRDILKEEANGKKSDQSEINAAMGKNMRMVFPLMTVFFAASFPGALALYWAAGTGVAIIQQRIVLGQDVKEMEVTPSKAEPMSNQPQKKKPRKGKKTTRSSRKSTKDKQG